MRRLRDQSGTLQEPVIVAFVAALAIVFVFEFRAHTAVLIGGGVFAAIAAGWVATGMIGDAQRDGAATQALLRVVDVATDPAQPRVALEQAIGEFEAAQGALGSRAAWDRFAGALARPSPVRARLLRLAARRGGYDPALVDAALLHPEDWSASEQEIVLKMAGRQGDELETRAIRALAPHIRTPVPAELAEAIALALPRNGRAEAIALLKPIAADLIAVLADHQLGREVKEALKRL